MHRLATASVVLALAGGLIGPTAATSAGAAESDANQAPLAPADVGFGVNHWAECGDYVPGLPPMSARLADPESDVLSAHYRVARVNDGAWTGAGSKVVGPMTSGTVAEAAMDPAWAKETDGRWIQTKYRWTVGAVEAGGEQLAGPRSAPCDFVLDMANPKLKVVNPVATVPSGGSVPIPEDDWLIVGTQLSMTLDPAGSKGYGGGNDVDYYRFGIDREPSTLDRVANPKILGSKHVLKIDTADITPGPHHLTVRSVDRAGRLSSAIEIRFNLWGPNFYAQYNFDEGFAASIAQDSLDDGARASTFTLQGGAGHSVNVPDQNFNLSLDGAAGTAVSRNPIVRPAAYRAFSLGAWARPSDVSRRQVLVSQAGASGTIYSLGIEPCAGGAHACAFFTLRSSTGTTYTARSADPARADVWIYLAGSFNDFLSSGPRIRVWAQGSHRDDAPDATPGVALLPRDFALPAMSSGHNRVGSELVGSDASGYWAGHVDELGFLRGELAQLDIRSQRLRYPPDGPLAP